MTGVPILRPPAQLGGGREYAVRLTTVDGDEHILCLIFNTPADSNGVPNLGAVKDFNPQVQAEANIKMTVAFAQRLPLKLPEGFVPPLTFEVEGGAHVMPVHVVSFRYLGPVEGREGGGTILRVRTPQGVAAIPVGEPLTRQT